MFSSSVYFTPCWAGKKPVSIEARDGEHMQAAAKAFSNEAPFRFSRVTPGRFSSSQPLGKF